MEQKTAVRELYSDIIGLKFNYLTVIDICEEKDKDNNVYVMCTCDCNNKEKKRVMLSKLKNGHIKSCGCKKNKLSSQRHRNKYKDLVGTTIGKLHIINIVDELSKRGSVMLEVECVCSPGTLKLVVASKVKNGLINDCGCEKNKEKSAYYRKLRSEYIGKEFGRLKILSLVEEKDERGHYYVRCQCNCENKSEVVTTITDLKRGRRVSCGCHVIERKKARIDSLIGQKFNRLTICSVSSEKTSSGQIKYLCKCDCGNPRLIPVILTRLKSGQTKSCGCYMRESVSIHNESKTKLYKLWSKIKMKCNNSNERTYPSFGGKGIKVCDDWANNYVVFKEWALLNGYKEGYSLDRKDKTKDFMPSNCFFKANSHGFTNTSLYKFWNTILKKNENIDLIYDDWFDFLKFREWAFLNGYTDDKKIVLIDVSKGFNPSNCKFVKNNNHGGSHTRLYKIWSGMKDRTSNPNANRYKFYGGKGIRVCDEWIDDFSAFRDWAIANGYEDRTENVLSLDREDNNKDYCPENCRWVTNKEQANNKTNNLKFTINGETKTLSQWVKEYNLDYKLVHSRIYNNKWDIERALNTPVLRER